MILGAPWMVDTCRCTTSDTSMIWPMFTRTRKKIAPASTERDVQGHPRFNSNCLDEVHSNSVVIWQSSGDEQHVASPWFDAHVQRRDNLNQTPACLA